jgi:hypothetical protein
MRADTPTTPIRRNIPPLRPRRMQSVSLRSASKEAKRGRFAYSRPSQSFLKIALVLVLVLALVPKRGPGPESRLRQKILAEWKTAQPCQRPRRGRVALLRDHGTMRARQHENLTSVLAREILGLARLRSSDAHFARSFGFSRSRANGRD